MDIVSSLTNARLVHVVVVDDARDALAMTTPRDTTLVTKAEVFEPAGGGSARVDR